MMRISSPVLRFLGVLTLLIPNARAQDAGERVTGRLAGGRVVEAVIHRPVNALSAAVRSGDSVIAATPAGGLLRFDEPNLRLTRERWDLDSPVVCLGRGEGDSVIAGLADGRVSRIDPTSLATTEIVRLTKEPVWIGWSPAAGDGKGGLVVATKDAVVHDLSTRRTIETKDKITTCLVDRDGRLWIGGDKGEWGGRVARIDLRTGIVVEVPPLPRPSQKSDPNLKPYWEGVYGFVELRDGQVWAFGGSMHMGINAASVTRVDELSPRTLFAYEQPDDLSVPAQPGPRAPVTHLVENEDGLIVLSYSDVFHVDRAFKDWKPVDPLRIRYKWGRFDAVGAYPAVLALLPTVRPGGPFVVATAGEGLILLEGDRAIPLTPPGRLGAPEVHRIENSTEGLLLIEGDELPIWTQRPDGWSMFDLAPPFEVDPNSDAPQFERDLRAWEATRVLVEPGGAVLTVSASGVDPGTVASARRERGRTVLLGRETSSFRVDGTFITPAGTLWNDGGEWLRRFSSGRWRRIARLPRGGPYQPVVVPTQEPPWLVLDSWKEEPALWKLVPGFEGAEPRLSNLSLKEGEHALGERAAIPWTDRLVLLSTDLGLRTYDAAREAIGRVDLPAPPKPATAMTRDRLGRVWLGGESGLHLSIPGAKVVEDFNTILAFRGAQVLALAPDPAHADGVVASLGARGVAFVRAVEP